MFSGVKYSNGEKKLNYFDRIDFLPPSCVSSVSNLSLRQQGPAVPQPATCESIMRQLAPDWLSRVIVMRNAAGWGEMTSTKTIEELLGGLEEANSFLTKVAHWSWGGKLLLWRKNVLQVGKNTHNTEGSINNRNVSYFREITLHGASRFGSRLQRFITFFIACKLLVFSENSWSKHPDCIFAPTVIFLAK